MTGLTLFTQSFADLGVIADGEVLSASMGQDALRRANNMIAGWRTQFETVTAVVRTPFALTADKQTYTIGLGGEFNVLRPVGDIPGAGLWLNGLDTAQSVSGITRAGYVATVAQAAHGLAVGDEALIAGAAQLDYNGLQTVRTVPTANTWTYAVNGTPVTPATGTLTSAAVNGQPVEVPTNVITDAAYQYIQIKNLPNSQFTQVYYNPTYPLGTIVLWPKPNTAINQLILYLSNDFLGFADLSTDYAFPDVPGYAEAIQYQLDLRLLTPYGVNDPAIVGSIREMAAQSFGLIKRANNKLTDLPSDASMFGYDRRNGYNINSGTGGGGGY